LLYGGMQAQPKHWPVLDLPTFTSIQAHSHHHNVETVFIMDTVVIFLCVQFIMSHGLEGSIHISG